MAGADQQSFAYSKGLSQHPPHTTLFMQPRGTGLC